MKLFGKAKSFLQIFTSVAIIFFALAVQPTKAQTAVTVDEFEGKALLISFPSTNVDSLSTVYSRPFTFAGYDGSLFATYPIYWTRLLSSTSGKPRILCVIKGTNTPLTSTSWQAADSISVNADSTETWGNGTIDLNAKKFAFYRLEITGTATNRDDTYAQYQLYVPYKKKN